MNLLDKGILDFCILVEPIDIDKYDYVSLPEYDTWGVIMHKNDKLSQKEYITKEDLLHLPLICSRQAISKHETNKFIEWFHNDFDKLNIVGTFNLAYNAVIMASEGLGYVITLDKLLNTSEYPHLIFKPLYPMLESKLNIIWKKQMIFSKPAQLFFDKLIEHFDDTNH